MDELKPYVRALEGLARQMTALKADSTATMQYHVLADAVFWSDETPSRLSAEEDDALRFLMRYRTSVLLGKPEEQWKCFWDAASRKFPSWIGFLPERVTPSPELREFYEKSVYRLNRRLKRVIEKL